MSRDSGLKVVERWEWTIISTEKTRPAATPSLRGGQWDQEDHGKVGRHQADKGKGLIGLQPQAFVLAMPHCRVPEPSPCLTDIASSTDGLPRHINSDWQREENSCLLARPVRCWHGRGSGNTTW
jgi:hypothetical protein